MAVRAKKKRKITKILMGLALLAALGFLSRKLYLASYEKYQINKKTTMLDAALAELSKQEDNLWALLGKLGDQSYIEKEARKKLNFQKPGEQSVIITAKDKDQKTQAKSAQKTGAVGQKGETKKSNIRLWIEFLFGE